MQEVLNDSTSITAIYKYLA